MEGGEAITATVCGNAWDERSQCECNANRWVEATVVMDEKVEWMQQGNEMNGMRAIDRPTESRRTRKNHEVRQKRL